jgi:hypothetical protein
VKEFEEQVNVEEAGNAEEHQGDDDASRVVVFDGH